MVGTPPHQLPLVFQFDVVPSHWPVGFTVTASVPELPVPQPALSYVTKTLPLTEEPEKPAFRRLSDEDLAKLNKFDERTYDPEEVAKQIRRAAFDAKLDAFLKAEGAVAWGRRSYRDGKLVSGEGYAFGANETPR